MMLLPEPGVTTGGFFVGGPWGRREGPAPAFEVALVSLIAVVIRATIEIASNPTGVEFHTTDSNLDQPLLKVLGIKAHV